MDFVFDRTAEGQSLECLTIVDDATHEAVAVEVERAFSGSGVARALDRLAVSRGLPQALRSDKGREFCGEVILQWADRRGVTQRLSEPEKPNFNAYVESFNGRLRDDCLNEHWFPNLRRARAVVETWRRESNQLLLKKTLGGVTPESYAKHLAEVRLQ